MSGGELTLENVNATGNTNSYGNFTHLTNGGVLNLNGGCTAGADNQRITQQTGDCEIHFRGSNNIYSLIYGYTNNKGTVIIHDGATINMTGNAGSAGGKVIYPNAGITFGANVTIINSAGQSVLLNGGVAGSCSVIKNDGTIE